MIAGHDATWPHDMHLQPHALLHRTDHIGQVLIPLARIGGEPVRSMWLSLQQPWASCCPWSWCWHKPAIEISHSGHIHEPHSSVRCACWSTPRYLSPHPMLHIRVETLTMPRISPPHANLCSPHANSCSPHALHLLRSSAWAYSRLS